MIDAPSPLQAARTLARKMVAEALLPPGARRSSAPLPSLIRGPFETPSGTNLVTASQAWSVPESSDAVVEFLKDNVPAGFRQDGTGSNGSGTQQASDLIDAPTAAVPNISSAMLEVRVAANGAGASIVNVVAVVDWTPRRPATEHVGAGDAW